MIKNSRAMFFNDPGVEVSLMFAHAHLIFFPPTYVVLVYVNKTVASMQGILLYFQFSLIVCLVYIKLAEHDFLKLKLLLVSL